MATINEINAKNGLKTYLLTIYADDQDQDGSGYYTGAKDYNEARKQIEELIAFTGASKTRFKVQEEK